MIIHLSKLLKFSFRKSHYVTFLVKKWNIPYQNTPFPFTTVDYLVYWRLKITLPLFFNGKKCWFFSLLSSFSTAIYQWDFFHQTVWGLASHQCKVHFDSFDGGLDTPYGYNNMIIAKQGPLDVWITWKRHMISWKHSLFIFYQLGW